MLYANTYINGQYTTLVVLLPDTYSYVNQYDHFINIMINVICLIYITGSFLLWGAIVAAVSCIVGFILICTLLVYFINKLITSYIITTLTEIFGGVIDKKSMSCLILMITVLY